METKSQKGNKQCIKCDVETCEYISNDLEECTLESIKVTSIDDEASSNDDTICASFKEKEEEEFLLFYYLLYSIFVYTYFNSSSIDVPISGGVRSKLSAIVAPISASV